MVAIPGSNDQASSPTGATSSMQPTASTSSETPIGRDYFHGGRQRRCGTSRYRLGHPRQGHGIAHYFPSQGESPVDFANRIRSLVVGLQPDPLADAQGLLTLKYCCTSDALRMKLHTENSYLGAHRACSLLLGQEFVGVMW
ncbi:hypothetical protein LIPSTDRAFT_322305 [Lipomyces starkeyi NRRL Y-11557]|uniref:Uncharacterized protein n=1 Tax=Lipomyces starkeyi NRRL Y-11557 TaxID=675824 RepID=A0A1E3Q3N9_LIPST|nr:hypothetical protein LIPSTDRAFT_322305 [Lipomyces starkeyi NRRL Y-11557]